MTAATLDEFSRSYAEAALFSSTDESTPSGGYPLDRNYGVDDIDPETLEHMAIDCEVFQERHGDQIDGHYTGPSYYSDRNMAGYHFWMTRNGHGTGFWQGDWDESVAEELTAAAKTFGEFNLYVMHDNIGDSGKIYGSRG